MQFDRLIVNPIWPWPLVVAMVALLFAVVLTTYPQRVRHLPPRQRRVLLGLRLLAALLLAMAVLRPEIQLRAPDERESALYILLDRSRSMQTPDAPGGKTRRAAARQTLQENSTLLDELGEEYDVRVFDFAETLEPADALSNEADGRLTAIGPTLESLEREIRGDRRSAVLLVSDGAERMPPGQNVDSRSVARRLGQKQTPVYTIGYGGAGLSESLDLAVEDLEVDSHPFEKNVVPVRARVRAIGAAGRRLEVRLLVEDRTGKQPGEAGEMKVPPATRTSSPITHVEPNRDSQVLPVEVSWVPQVPGEFKIAVEVVPVEGELRRQNNEQATIITVQRGGISILYFDHPVRPEQKWIRFSNRSKKIQLDFQPLPAGDFASQAGAAADLFAPGRYDAYVIGDVPARLFEREQLEQLRRRIDEGAGLLMIGGFQSFGPGGYGGTPLEDVLPVVLEGGPAGDGARLDPSQHYTQDLEMVPTRRGLNHFIMRLGAADENEERWQALPPMRGANRLREKNQAVEILAESAGPERLPLLFTSEPGLARVMAFAADSTWLWALEGHADSHQRFWQQMLLYLARKEQDGDQPVWVKVEPRNFATRQPVEVTLGARDEDGQPLAGAELALEVFHPEAEPARPPVQSRDDAHFATFAATESPGDYWVRASGTKDGESLGPDAWTRFVVDSRDLELDNPAADYSLLDAISENSGGRRLQPEELAGFLRQLIERGLPQSGDLTRIDRISLWDGWPLLLLFVGVMSLEWFLRKRRGLV